jgi:uncharacterized NAD(P)/FAD-binding protein YdhS
VLSDPSRMREGRRLAIVGGGFSGSLLAINLLRHGGPRAILVERASLAGRGLAYATEHDCHLLNVRAANMSAFAEAPDHFVRWLVDRGLGGPTDFVPRATYGRYIQDMLEAEQAAHPGRLEIIGDEVMTLKRGQEFRLTLASGRAIEADGVVLALGNLPPHPPPGLDPAQLPADVYVEDPWRTDIVGGLRTDDKVLLLGTGLTAIDVAVLLQEQGFSGGTFAVSRRGLLPRAHADGIGSPPPLAVPPEPRILAILRQLRSDSSRMNWRHAVDRLRPHSQLLWARLPPPERARFLRHARPWWDVHRHRLAPQVATKVETLIRDGRLETLGARLVSAEAEEAGRVDVRLRGRDGRLHRLSASRIVNCTGPTGDLRRSREPLLRQLLADGLARPDPLALGLDLDHLGRVRDARGRADPDLWAVGPMARAAFWEITAVPDIRSQVAALARRLAGAHWVGGEGL